MYKYKYPRAALTVDAIVITGREKAISVLLVQRGNEPFKGKWALPGGFVNLNETLEMACRRELVEETGLKVKKMNQFRVYDAIDRDPRHRTISVIFYAKIQAEEKVNAGDDAALARWFPVSQLPELAFDHNQILNEFLEKYSQ